MPDDTDLVTDTNLRMVTEALDAASARRKKISWTVAYGNPARATYFTVDACSASEVFNALDEREIDPKETPHAFGCLVETADRSIRTDVRGNDAALTAKVRKRLETAAKAARRLEDNKK